MGLIHPDGPNSPGQKLCNEIQLYRELNRTGEKALPGEDLISYHKRIIEEEVQKQKKKKK